jgi:transposase-like protein
MSLIAAVPSIPDLSQAFSTWRSEHKKHARLPEDLKRKAVLLAQSRGPREVARAIGIAPGRLGGWVDRYRSTSPNDDYMPPQSEFPPFIDVTSALMPPSVPSQQMINASIDVAVPDRGSLKITGAFDAATIRFIVSTAFGGGR